VSGAEVAVIVDPPTLFPGQTPQWRQRLKGETVHGTLSENLKLDRVFATFMVASNAIALHGHS
jgi:hypothetical protein